MSTSKSAALTATDLVDWTGVPLQRIEYEPAATIFAQGDPATSVMYVATGAVRLTVVSHAGKEAVIAVAEAGHFSARAVWRASRCERRPRRRWVDALQLERETALRNSFTWIGGAYGRS